MNTGSLAQKYTLTKVGNELSSKYYLVHHSIEEAWGNAFSPTSVLQGPMGSQCGLGTTNAFCPFSWKQVSQICFRAQELGS
jgi:hypothetical protein